MHTSIYMDWLPFSSPAIQTNIIQVGLLSRSRLEVLLSDSSVAFACYALRLDGIYVFSLHYTKKPTREAAVAHSVQITDSLRRAHFGFDFLPRPDTRKSAQMHRPAEAEDIYSDAFLQRVRHELPEAAGWQRPDPANENQCLDYLISVTANDSCLCLLRRNHSDPYRSKHLCCLYLKALMGKRKNHLEQAFAKQERHERMQKNHIYDAVFITALLFALVAVYATLVLLVETSETSYRRMFFSSARDMLQKIISYQTLSFLATFGAVVIIITLYLKYQFSYKRRIFILTNAVSYFSNCCQYGATVAAMYERILANPQFASSAIGRLYSQRRSFEGIIEELKVRILHEQVRFRDQGILHSIAAGSLSILAHYFTK